MITRNEIEEALILATSNINDGFKAINANKVERACIEEFVSRWNELGCDPQGASAEQSEEQDELIDIYADIIIEAREIKSKRELIYTATWSANNSTNGVAEFTDKGEALDWARACAQNNRYDGNKASFKVSIIETGEVFYDAIIERNGKIVYSVKD